MAALAKKQGITQSSMLLTKQATVEAVTEAIQNAAKKLAKGDLFFLTYSGHGGQVPDTNGDEEEDRKDETWVLFDRQLVDDDLYQLYSKFKSGVRPVNAFKRLGKAKTIAACSPAHCQKFSRQRETTSRTLTCLFAVARLCGNEPTIKIRSLRLIVGSRLTADSLVGKPQKRLDVSASISIRIAGESVVAHYMDCQAMLTSKLSSLFILNRNQQSWLGMLLQLRLALKRAN